MLRTWWHQPVNLKSQRDKLRLGGTARGKPHRRLQLERLEDRTMPTIIAPGIPNWVEQGPGPIFGPPNMNQLPAQGFPHTGAINLELRPQPFAVGGQREHTLASCLKEQVVEPTGMVQHQGVRALTTQKQTSSGFMRGLGKTCRK